jgi:hypothetical protein
MSKVVSSLSRKGHNEPESSEKAKRSSLTPIDNVITHIEGKTLGKPASREKFVIPQKQEAWTFAFEEWKEKNRNIHKTEKEFAEAFLLDKGIYTEKDRLDLLYFAVKTYMGDAVAKRLPNDITIVLDESVEGRKKYRLYSPDINLLGRGAVNTANKVEGISFVLREGVLTSKQVHSYVHLYKTAVGEGREEEPEELDPGIITQITLHEEARKLDEEGLLGKDDAVGVEVTEKGILRGIGKAPVVASSSEVYEKFYKGGSLKKWIEKENPPPLTILEAYREALYGLRALAYFFARHIDLSPFNLTVDIPPKIVIRDFGDVHICKPLNRSMNAKEVLEEVRNNPFTIKKNFTPAYTIMSDGILLTNLEVACNKSEIALAKLLENPYSDPDLIEAEKNNLIDKRNAFLAPIEKFQVFEIGLSLFESVCGEESLRSFRMSPPFQIVMKPIDEKTITASVDRLNLPAQKAEALKEFFLSTIGTQLEERASSLDAFQLYQEIFPS